MSSVVLPISELALLFSDFYSIPFEILQIWSDVAFRLPIIV